MSHKKGLSRTFLKYENFYILFFLFDLYFTESFDFDKKVLITAGITLFKYLYEGFRLAFLFQIAAIIIAILIDNWYGSLFGLILLILITLYFPIYDFPKAFGQFFAGYRELELQIGTKASVFYPTVNFTSRPKYSPHSQAWERIYTIQKVFGDPFPKALYRFALGFMDHVTMQVNENAKLLSSQLLTHSKKFPVIIFSHGMSSNRNIHASLLKEWATNGYICFSIDHDEQIEIENMSMQEMQALRFEQIEKRSKQISQILDVIYNKAALEEFFDGADVEVDYSKISIAGQSFGAATAAYHATQDKRITGSLILLDPWMFPLEHQLKDTQVNLPTLILRTPGFNLLLPEIFKNKERAMEFLTKNNKHMLKSSMCCYLKNSNHVSQSDLLLYIPREMRWFKLLESNDMIYKYSVHNQKLTAIFMEVMHYEKETTGGAKPDISQVEKRFNKALLKEEMDNLLIIDNIEEETPK